MIIQEPTEYIHVDSFHDLERRLLAIEHKTAEDMPRNRKERRELKRKAGGFKKNGKGW